MEAWRPWALSAALTAALVASALAQTPGTPPPTAVPPPAAREPLSEVQGAVQAIDRQIEAIRVASPRDARPGTVLHFSNGTEVVIRGAAGSIGDLREGDRVRAWYENRSGIYLLRRIEVLAGS